MHYRILYSALLLTTIHLHSMNENDQGFNDLLKKSLTFFALETCEYYKQQSPSSLSTGPQLRPPLVSNGIITKPIIAKRIKSGQKNAFHPGSFECRLGCGKTLATASGIRRHEQNDHANMLPYQCALCRRAFFSSLGLAQHLNMVHYTGQNN